MKTFQNKSMLVRFSSGIGFSSRKKDAKVTKDVAREQHADEDSVDVFKRLLPRGALDAWQDAIAAARDVHEEMTLPWRDDGYRVLKSSRFNEYTDAMRKHRRLVEAERDKFEQVYPKYKEDAPRRLNGMYNPKDFPDIQRLLKRFKFKTDFLPVPSGEDFRVDLADEDLQEIRDQIDRDAKANVLRPLLPPIQHMVARLSEPDPTFRNTLVKNIEEILKLVPQGDPEVDNLMAQIKSDLIVPAETLRQSPSARRNTAAKANAILATMAGYLSTDATPSAPPMTMPEPEPMLVPESVPAEPVPVETPQPQNTVETSDGFDPVAYQFARPDGTSVPLPVASPSPTWRRALRRTSGCQTATLL